MAIQPSDVDWVMRGANVPPEPFASVAIAARAVPAAGSVMVMALPAALSSGLE